MKKVFALLLAASMLFALAACGTGELYIHEPTVTAPPVSDVPVTPVIEEPSPAILETLGDPVILNIKTITGTYEAPDDSGRTILTYGYQDVDLFLQNKPQTANRINQFLDLKDEIYYSGTGDGDGLNAMLEWAIDNYSLSKEANISANLEFSSMRSAYVDRGDSRILSLRYRVNSYTGGAHGSYVDRAYVFDLSDGALLTLDDIASDRGALEQAMLAKMTDTVQNDVRYQTIRDYMLNFRTDSDLESALKELFREGSWFLNDEGLVVFSDLYEIGSYADGIIRFTLSYEELQGLISDRYMPVERPEGGSLQILDIDHSGAASVSLIDKVTVSEDGSEFRVFASGTVYDVTIDSVTYIDDGVGFYVTDMHWFCSYLSNSGVQVQTGIPQGMPDLMVRCVDENGDAFSYLVTQSAEDGSVLLLQEEHVTAVG